MTIVARRYIEIFPSTAGRTAIAGVQHLDSFYILRPMPDNNSCQGRVVGRLKNCRATLTCGLVDAPLKPTPYHDPDMRIEELVLEGTGCAETIC
jgi:hypothetical protein